MEPPDRRRRSGGGRRGRRQGAKGGWQALELRRHGSVASVVRNGGAGAPARGARTIPRPLLGRRTHPATFDPAKGPERTGHGRYERSWPPASWGKVRNGGAGAPDLDGPHLE